MTENLTVSPSITTTLPLNEDQALALPPEIRDQLLDYLELWGKPDEVLRLLHFYRETHGPLLSFLDREAVAQMAAGNYPAAIDAIEQRQRRSTTIESQALEARALLGAGHWEAAEAVAIDISTAYATRAVAVDSAAEIFSANGDFPRARTLVEALLAQRPGNQAARLTLARLALNHNEKELAGDLVQQLGAGISPTLEVADLRVLEGLHRGLGNAQSAEAATLELERQRMLSLEALQSAMQPIIGLVTGGGDVDRIYNASERARAH